MEVKLDNGKSKIVLTKPEERELRNANELVSLMAKYGDNDAGDIKLKLKAIVARYCSSDGEPSKPEA